MIKAVLFDMDGVLLDSEEFICEAAMKMFAEKGLETQPKDFLPFVGAGEDKYLGGVAKKYAFSCNISEIKARTYEIYAEIIKGRVHAFKGVTEFISRCKAKGLKLAVATSADKVKMQVNLKEIGITETTFHALVNGLDVERKKPHPDIYELAAKKLGVAPIQCLVVEDAINGVEAAKNAGAKCLGLTTSFTQEDLKLADWVYPNLVNVPDAVISW